MNGAGGDEVALPLLHGHKTQNIGQRVGANGLFHLSASHVLFKAVVNTRTLFAIQDVPHLGLAELILIGQRILITGVHLHGQVALCVDELDQLRKILERSSLGTQIGVLQRLGKSGAIRQIAGAIGMSGQHPRLGDTVHILDAVIVHQLIAAPNVILKRRGQFHDFTHINTSLCSIAIILP